MEKFWTPWDRTGNFITDDEAEDIKKLEDDPNLLFSRVGNILLLKVAPCPGQIGQTVIYRSVIVNKKTLIDHEREEFEDYAACVEPAP